MMMEVSSTTAFGKLRYWCFAGLVLCCYAAYVERMAETDPQYTALCDINRIFSCTSVFTSPYGRGFGLMQYFLDMKPPPNGYIGIFYFIFAIYIIHIGQKFLMKVLIFLSFVSNLMSLYLLYLLVFVLKEMCIVCLIIYLVNFSVLHYSRQYYKEIFPTTQTTSHMENEIIKEE